MWLLNENRIMSYSEYILSEAIKPKPINYGTDFNNSKWKNVGLGFKLTHFKTNEYIYTYIFRDGFVGFFASDLDKEEEILSENSITNIFKNTKLFTRKDTSKFISVFNYFFYVTLEAIKKFNLDKIMFDGADKALGDLYSSMSRNKFFLKELEKIGFVYDGLTRENNREFYTFTKEL